MKIILEMNPVLMGTSLLLLSFETCYYGKELNDANKFVQNFFECVKQQQTLDLSIISHPYATHYSQSLIYSRETHVDEKHTPKNVRKKNCVKLLCIVERV